MRITDYPDLLRTKGKEPMPQAWDETNQDWTPAIDSAATLKALREALGAPADATQADPVQEATAIALLKGLLELTAMRATDQTLTQIKQAVTEGVQRVELTGNRAQLIQSFATGVVAAGALVTLGECDMGAYRRIVAARKDGDTSLPASIICCWRMGISTSHSWVSVLLDKRIGWVGGSPVDVLSASGSIRLRNDGTSDADFGTVYVYGLRL